MNKGIPFNRLSKHFENRTAFHNPVIYENTILDFIDSPEKGKPFVNVLTNDRNYEYICDITMAKACKLLGI